MLIYFIIWENNLVMLEAKLLILINLNRESNARSMKQQIWRRLYVIYVHKFQFLPRRKQILAIMTTNLLMFARQTIVSSFSHINT
jgi:hypothetical protein